MKYTDKALLLKRTNYGDTSLVLNMFCLEKGYKSFMFRGAKKKMGYLMMPLSLLEITYFERSESQLAQMTTVDNLVTLHHIPSDPRKSAVLFFLCDILYACIREENVAQKDLFLFLSAELVELDQAPFQANYPLYVVMALTAFLGFEPSFESEKPHFFDMYEGIFGVTSPGKAQINLVKDEVTWLANAFQMNKDQILDLPLSRSQRQRYLRILLDYYSFHVNNFSNPKSLKVLEEVFD